MQNKKRNTNLFFKAVGLLFAFSIADDFGFLFIHFFSFCTFVVIPLLSFVFVLFPLLPFIFVPHSTVIMFYSWFCIRQYSWQYLRILSWYQGSARSVNCKMSEYFTFSWTQVIYRLLTRTLDKNSRVFGQYNTHILINLLPCLKLYVKIIS